VVADGLRVPLAFCILEAALTTKLVRTVVMATSLLSDVICEMSPAGAAPSAETAAEGSASNDPSDRPAAETEDAAAATAAAGNSAARNVQELSPAVISKLLQAVLLQLAPAALKAAEQFQARQGGCC
jgi:hypothetical protein